MFLVITPAFAACPIPDTVQKVRVEKAFDGDTVRLSSGQSVRLIGVNTPEMNYKRGKPEVGALAARQFVQSLLSDISSIQLGTQPRDRYGRTLGHLFLRDGRSLEELLLKQGQGYYLAIPPNVLLQDCLRAAEREAREQSLGVWRNGRWPQDATDLNPGTTGFVILRGQITKVSRSNKAWYLELDNRIALKLDADVLVLFDDAHKALIRLKSRLEVRGWLIDRSRYSSVKKNRYKPLFINVSHPDHLQFLTD
ncbi:thermonuclease family protein [Pontibacterium sp.]|uniref:thermonuclease family protein n=1 Tax=Pontibacterium sp. TaxID=2036026 RepID=UPI003561DABC